LSRCDKPPAFSGLPGLAGQRRLAQVADLPIAPLNAAQQVPPFTEGLQKGAKNSGDAGGADARRLPIFVRGWFSTRPGGRIAKFCPWAGLLPFEFIPKITPCFDLRHEGLNDSACTA